MSILKEYTISDNNTIQFINSANIKVFPCAYRGYKNGNSIDPEAKSNTEYNYTNLFCKLGKNKVSYVVEYPTVTGPLKCIIGGYYFEITGVTADNLKGKYLAICTEAIDLPANDASRQTKVLSPIITSNDNHLDTILPGSTEYYFIGLAITSTTRPYDAYLMPFNSDGTRNWAAHSIYDVIDTGTGVYSLRTLCDTTTNNASGKYSVAIGEGTSAIAEGQIVLGKYNIANTTDIVIIGDGDDNLNRENLFSISKTGDINTAGTITAGNKLTVNTGGADINGNVNVINGTLTSAKKLTVNSEGAEIIGNSTINGTVGITGNTSITGTTTVIGNTSVTGTLTTTSTITSNGKLTVSNGGADIVGNSTINGTVEITGDTSVTGSLSTTSAITSGGKLTVSAGGADISGGIDITGGAEIAGGIDVTSGGLTVSGNSTITGSITASGTNGKLVTGANLVEFGDSSKYIKYNSSNSQFEISNQVEVKGKVHATNFIVTGNDSEMGNIKTGEIDTSNSDIIAGSGTVYSGSVETGAISASDISASSIKIEVPDDAEEGTKALSTTGEIETGTLTTSGNTTIGSTTSNAALTVNGETTVKKIVVTGSGADITGESLLKGKTTIGSNETNANLVVHGAGEFKKTLTLSSSGNALTVNDSATIGNIKIETEVSDDSTVTNIKDVNKINAVNIETTGKIEADDIIKSDSYIEATYFNATSDRRLKQNIEDYKCDKSILDLSVKKYEFINKPGKTHIGCIAQDLQEICPELVSEDENGYLSIQENKLVYLLLQEIKELKDRITKLERR